MRISGFGRYALSCVAAAMLAACGDRAAITAAPSANAAGGGWLAPETHNGKRLIYVANGNDILVLPDHLHDPSIIGRITSGVKGAQGLCVDGDGNLYVANGWGNTVTVYAQGSITPSRTYTEGIDDPDYPAVDRHSNLFVSNDYGKVTEYRRGQTRLYRTLQATGTTNGIALDSHGNLFVSYRTDYRHGSLEEFTPGSTQPLILPIPLDQPQGLLVTRAGTFVVVQTGNADGVYVIDPTKPHGSQFVQQIGFHVRQTPVQVALSSDERKLFVSEFGWTGEGSVYEADYPIVQSSPTTRVFHQRVKFIRRGPHRRYSIQGLAISDAEVP